MLSQLTHLTTFANWLAPSLANASARKSAVRRPNSRIRHGCSKQKVRPSHLEPCVCGRRGESRPLPLHGPIRRASRHSFSAPVVLSCFFIYLAGSNISIPRLSLAYGGRRAPNDLCDLPDRQRIVISGVLYDLHYATLNTFRRASLACPSSGRRPLTRTNSSLLLKISLPSQGLGDRTRRTVAQTRYFADGFTVIPFVPQLKNDGPYATFRRFLSKLFDRPSAFFHMALIPHLRGDSPRFRICQSCIGNPHPLNLLRLN